jgi:hypothetical protein
VKYIDFYEAGPALFQATVKQNGGAFLLTVTRVGLILATVIRVVEID